MRAVAARKAGETPELMELPVPHPGPGEVLVELAAASLNPIDMGIAQGYFEDRLPRVHPIVLGVDGAGRVAETGEGVRRLTAEAASGRIAVPVQRTVALDEVSGALAGTTLGGTASCARGETTIRI
jgi:NADPH:quinone reductase-like Zn-dependent oxidoreductase